MARNAFNARLRLLSHLYQQARQQQLPPELLLNNHRQGLSRRAMLKGVGAASLLPWMGCRDQSVKTNDPSERVVIIGAGLAGLNCCHRLAKAGIQAEVYEARDRVGGRMWTGYGIFADAPDLWTELGGEFVNGMDRELRGLCDELDLSLIDLWKDEELPAIAWINGRRYTEVEMMNLLGPLTDACLAALSDLDQHGDHISYKTPSGASALDQMSAAEFLDQASIDPVAASIASLYCVTEYGLDMADQSALNLIFLFVGSGTYDERYKVRGGNGQVPHLLAERYADQIHLEQRLIAIKQGSDSRYTLSFENGTEVSAAYVVLSLPFTLLREVDIQVDLPAAKRKAIDELGYGTNAKLVLPFRSHPWRDQGDLGDLITDLGLQVGWESSQLQGGEFAIFANFVGGQHGLEIGSQTAAVHGEIALDQLETIWPGSRAASGGDAQRVLWPEDPFVKGSYACYRPGQWTTLGGAEAEQVDRLYFAGEHTSTEFQGYLNGAAQSGRDAAEDLLADLQGQQRRARRVRAGRRWGG